MSKLFLLASLPIFLFFANNQLTTKTVTTTPSTNKVETIADLSPEEKAAFIKQMVETGNCEFKGKKLYGKVQFVTSFPDIKIQYVTSFPDIKVKFVSSFADDCGEWQEVTSFPDFKVQVVSSFPDLKVQKVTSFPGMN